MTATDAQVRIMMREREKGRTQEQAAASANLRSRKTAVKYEQLGKLPSEMDSPRRYRTRQDPFAADWPTMEKMLENAPTLEGMKSDRHRVLTSPTRRPTSHIKSNINRYRGWSM